jgi:hypothetical protein
VPAPAERDESEAAGLPRLPVRGDLDLSAHSHTTRAVGLGLGAEAEGGADLLDAAVPVTKRQ